MTKCSPQLCISNQVRFLPAAPSTPTPFSVIHILTLTFMGPLDRGEAEYIEPERRCRRGGEGADKAWWKKVEWSGWVVALKVAQHCATRKVNNQTSQLLFRSQNRSYGSRVRNTSGSDCFPPFFPSFGRSDQLLLAAAPWYQGWWFLKRPCNVARRGNTNPYSFLSSRQS